MNTSNILLESIYVDDLITTASSFEEVNEIYEQFINILQGANMNLRKWFSNIKL